MTFDDDFYYFFDESNRVVGYEARDIDNYGDELLKIVHGSIVDVENQIEGESFQL